MLEQWEVDRMIAWRKEKRRVDQKHRLLGNAEFTRKAANDKLAAISGYQPREFNGAQFIGGRATCVASPSQRKRAGSMRQGSLI